VSGYRSKPLFTCSGLVVGYRAKEKQVTRERDAVSAERRQLPWVKVESSFLRAASHSSRDTIFDFSIVLFAILIFPFHLMSSPGFLLRGSCEILSTLPGRVR
jgi:predicted dithiol-disulfide oxidoreductase (DUF899 family)